uniref:Uncharacterized protein n=1 Tax=Ascaris lumbricoides TaxID=6252 RepID=A0A0M3IQT4_ASCLU
MCVIQNVVLPTDGNHETLRINVRRGLDAHNINTLTGNAECVRAERGSDKWAQRTTMGGEIDWPAQPNPRVFALLLSAAVPVDLRTLFWGCGCTETCKFRYVLL